MRVYEGDLFAGALPSDTMLPLAHLQMLAPELPGNIIAHWNNFHTLGEKPCLSEPAEPIYLIKANNSLLAPYGVICKLACDGKGVFGERVTRISDCFTRAGFKAPVLDRIRFEIGLRRWGNLTLDLISSLAHSTLADICQYPPSCELAASMMREYRR